MSKYFNAPFVNNSSTPTVFNQLNVEAVLKENLQAEFYHQDIPFPMIIIYAVHG